MHSRLAYDAPSWRSLRDAFNKARRAELHYARSLRTIAGHIGDLVRATWSPDDRRTDARISAALDQYAVVLKPWAEKVGERMVAEVSARDAKAWRQAGEQIGRGIRQELEHAPIGHIVRASQERQVELITSLPIEAGRRVHELARDAIASGKRPDEVAAEIMRTGEVTKARATTIARTEVSRANTELTMARAKYVGSPGYTWRTSRDGRVRPSHQAMQGKFVAWELPPTLDGMVGHAGCFPNCRCWVSPLIPD